MRLMPLIQRFKAPETTIATQEAPAVETSVKAGRTWRRLYEAMPTPSKVKSATFSALKAFGNFFSQAASVFNRLRTSPILSNVNIEPTAKAIFDRFEERINSAKEDKDNLYYYDSWMHDFTQSKQFGEMKLTLQKIVDSIPSKTDESRDLSPDYTDMLAAITELSSSFKDKVTEWTRENNLDPKTIAGEECLSLTILLVGKSRIPELLGNKFQSHLEKAITPANGPALGITAYYATTLEVAISFIKQDNVST